MRYCVKCGQQLTDGDAFCSNCGVPVRAETPAPALVPVAPPVSAEALKQEEQTFLETTHRLLRWERKAWSITSKVFIIMGSIFAALFMMIFFIGMVAAMDGERDAEFIMILGFMYAFIFGGMFIAIGIVNKKAADKIPQYTDTIYTNFSLAYNRCGNVGMLVFSAICGTISPIFFIINFVRMKSSRAVIERIIKNQSIHR